VNNVLFPVGTAGNYRSFNISFTGAITIGGTLTASFVPTDPGSSGLPLDDGGVSIINVGKEGYWTAVSGNGLAGGTYSLDLYAEGFSGVSVVSTLRLLKRSTGGSWLLQGTHSAGTGTITTPVVHRTGMSGFSEFGVGGASDNPLPVELLSFSAVITHNGIKLKWNTRTEVSNYGFDVERAPVNPQSKVQILQFEKIGFIKGNGNSNSQKEYSFTDNNAQYGNYAYRLKQIDTDGNYEFSKVIEVDAGKIPDGFVLEQNYPNPFNPKTTIKFALAETQKTELKVYDIIGNEVATLFNQIAEGGVVYELEFNVINLPSGIYIYRLNSRSYSKSKKMLLLK
jgi:hypothetical protein